MSGHARWALLVTLICASTNLGGTDPAAIQAPSCFADAPARPIQGLDNGASCTFFGIPYAASPAGNQRWKPPQALPATDIVFNAVTMPANCPNINTGSFSGNEDCLKLNIWTPDPKPSRPAPVIVWLHTGAFLAASANFGSHRAERLVAETGAIVVAPNYRLGPLGFLAHPLLAAENAARPVSGNYGLLDQRASLHWVRNNIAAFGGDPGNITVAGTSAGGESAGLHLVMPGSGGLFQRAAVHSAALTVRWPTHAESLAQGNAFATNLGCTIPSTALTCLRSKSPPEILFALPLGTQQVTEQAGRVLWQPVVDGLEIPDQPRALFEAGLFHHVPTIIGFMRDEGWGNFLTRSFPGANVSLTQYENWVNTEFGSAGAAVLSQYPAADFPSPAEALARVVGDGQFACDTQRVARNLSDSHQAVFVFSYEHVINDLSVGHVIHGVESNILFGNPYAPPTFATHPLNATDNALHAAMAGYWTRFAATGIPHTDPVTEVPWPQFKDPLGDGRGSNRFLVIEPNLRPGKRLSETNKCDFWDGLFLRTMLGTVPAGS
jgi:para-nitrobenzyl esterase